MNTLDAILSRRSCREFTAEQISEEELQTLIAAANAAPVGMGRFDGLSLTVIQDQSLLAKIEEKVKAALPPERKLEHPLYQIPTGILVCARKGDERETLMYALSASCVVENILLAATELGLGSVYLMAAAVMLAQDPALMRAARVPEGFAPVAMAGVGHSSAPAQKREPVCNKIALERI